MVAEPIGGFWSSSAPGLIAQGYFLRLISLVLPSLHLVYLQKLSSLGFISLVMRAADTCIVSATLWYNQELKLYILISKNHHPMSKLNTARWEHKLSTFIFCTNTGVLKL